MLFLLKNSRTKFLVKCVVGRERTLVVCHYQLTTRQHKTKDFDRRDEDELEGVGVCFLGFGWQAVDFRWDGEEEKTL